MIEMITYGSCRYPDLLAEIKDPPKELYCLGNIDILKKRCVAVVGSRTTTQYGRSTAVSIAAKLAERDVAVVSGMARGIDTCAHRGALDNGGTTIAVLGCGVDICYPKENSNLKKEIERAGLVISEYPPKKEPMPFSFPRRNRIISGLSEMTVVVQARNESGALITAEFAAEQGREVFAVPGNIDSQYNLGNNKLIKDGVGIIIKPSDVLEALGINSVDKKEAEKILSDNEMLIFNMLSERGEMTVDELCMALKKPPSYVSSIVSVMELKGTVLTAVGKIFIAKG